MPGTAKDIKIIIRAEVDKALKELEKTERGLDDVSRSGKRTSTAFAGLKTAAASFMGALAIREIAQTTIELGKLGARAEAVERAFSRRFGPAATQTMNELRASVKGTVSDFELMKTAIQGIKLGATNDQLETFAKFARLEALEQGADTLTVFNNIISGVLRGSTELLDNFGISLTELNGTIEELAAANGKNADSLSAVERRVISVDAAVKIMNERLADTGDLALEDSEKIQTMGAEFENMKVEIGKLLDQPLASFFGGVAGVLRDVGDALRDERGELEAQQTEFNSLINKLIEFNGKAKLTDKQIQDRKTLIEQLNTKYGSYLGNIDLDKTGNEDLRRILHRVNAELQTRIALMAAEEEVKEALREVIDAQKNYNEAVRTQAVAQENARLARQKTIETETQLTPLIESQKIAALEYLDAVDRKGNLTRANTATQINRELELTRSYFEDRSRRLQEDVEARRSSLNEQTKLYEQYVNEIKSLTSRLSVGGEEEDFRKGGKSAKGDAGTGLPDADKVSEEQARLTALRISNIEDEYERRRAIILQAFEDEAAGYRKHIARLEGIKGERDLTDAEAADYARYTSLVEQLEINKNKKIAQLNKERRLAELQEEYGQARKIADIKENTALLNARDEFERRLLAIEQYYKREIELAGSNAELVAALEDEKAAKVRNVYDDLADHIAAHYMQNNELAASFANAANAAYESFIGNVLDTQQTGSEKLEAMWESAKQAFVRSIGDMLREYISSKMKELLISQSVEGGKTAAKASGAATRATIAQGEVATSAEVSAANTAEAASGFFAAHSSIPYVGYAIAAAFVIAMLAMLSNIGGKKRGGLIRPGDIFAGIGPKDEDGIIGVQAGEYVVDRDTTRRNLPVLEAMRRGEGVRGTSQSREDAKGIRKELFGGDGHITLNPSLKGDRDGGLRLPTGFALNRGGVPGLHSSYRERIVERELIDRTVPVEGKITVETADPGFARVRDHYVRVNRDIIMDDQEYVNTMLKTRNDGEYD